MDLSHFEEILHEEVGAVGVRVITIILIPGTEAPSYQDCPADPAARGPYLLRFLKTIAIQRVSQYLRKAPLLWLLESRFLHPEQRKVKTRTMQRGRRLGAKKLVPVTHLRWIEMDE